MTKSKMWISLCLAAAAGMGVAHADDTPVNYAGGPAPGDVFGALSPSDQQLSQLPLNCSGLGTTPPSGAAYRFDTMTFTNSSSSSVTVTYNSADASGICNNTTNDPEFIVYNGSFSPTSPLVNCEQVVTGSNACITANFTVGAGATKIVLLTSRTPYQQPALTTPQPQGNPSNGLFGYQNTFSSPTPVSLQSFSVDQN